MAKFAQKIEARKLRRKGQSIKGIAKSLNVSPASVSEWCHDISLTVNQIKILELHSRDPSYGRRLTYSLKQKQQRVEKTKRLMEEGKKDVGILSERELFIAGIALYWAEGFKKDSQAGLANLDPYMIKFFIRWLNECFHYHVDNLILRVTVNISHKERINEIEGYWSTVTGFPVDKFQKPFFQKVLWKKVYENPNDYHGILRVKVRKSVDFLRRLNGCIEGLRMTTD
ncbi:MAG: hypothetical protein UT39_C0002G0041 [Candidatus Woesebacteria bacterium GW2011_GWA1_39_21]|uniref:Uncharacterized protein n=1 Tax=Candidatus Woesebacteria bacterium GW2011_GWA1_39_21 TaxID=1618550 RepID=A0A0G0QN91_9BACT|nr:MAG: hypothetical protein UT39_C0002G0041 [Candidatus Woesebacteria bacterium GW2011_GWA1_39_21]